MDKLNHIHRIKNTNKKKFISKILFVFVFLIFGIFTHQSAEAATLYFSPSTGNFNVGNVFTVNVFVNSEGVAINNAEATINFPSDLLEVMSVSKSGSIFSLWVEEPTFSNSAGTLTFNGGLPTPGFNDASGKILSVVFRAKAGGSASLLFSSPGILANDGYGTDVFRTGLQAYFSLISNEQIVPREPEISSNPIVGNVPSAPQISSMTHPDQDKWYSNNNPSFVWRVSNDVTAVRLLYDKLSTSRPSVIYKPPISEKKLEDMKDGVWYFHAQFSNANDWGGSAHFRFQIDTEKPTRFDVAEIPRSDTTDPKVKFIFDASDETSGIDYYEIQIDNGSPKVWKDDGSRVYETPVVTPGKHTLLAKAFDKAGNSLATSAEFTIETIDSPKITEYSKELESGNPLMVQGSTYPVSKVTIWLQKEKDDAKSFVVESDSNGKFVYTASEKLGEGIYQVWAEVTDARGAQSLPSEKVTTVVAKSAIFRVGTWAASFLSVIVPVILLVVLLIFGLWYSWYKFLSLKKRIRRDASRTESELHKAFDVLREDMQDQIKMLEKAQNKRELTKEEDKIVKRLKKDLDDVEKIVKKKIKDLEDETE